MKRWRASEKNVSPGSVAGELVQSALVYFGLEDEKGAGLEAMAREGGVSLDQVVQAAVKIFLEQKKEK